MKLDEEVIVASKDVLGVKEILELNEGSLKALNIIYLRYLFQWRFYGKSNNN